MQISIISTVPELHQVGLPRNLIISYIIYHHFRKVKTILNLYFDGGNRIAHGFVLVCIFPI